MTHTLDTVAPEIERDRFGRPLVVPPDGGKPVAYTRCTTYVGCLEDTYNLGLWQQRQVAIGMGMRKDLVLAAAAHRGDRDELDRIAKAASEAARSSAGATTGTALHRLAQDLDAGLALDDLPDDAQRDLDAYREATKRLTHKAIERFVVLDELKVGGTFDRLCEVDMPDFPLPVIADIKTGNVEYGIGKIAMQLAVYAHGALYDPGTHERTSLGSVDLNRGLVIHLPAGSGTCELIEVDIAAGWRAVTELAGRVRAWRKLKFADLARRIEVVDNAATPKTVEPRQPSSGPTLADRVADARSVDELGNLWREHAHEWTDELTELAKARKALLAGKLA